MWKVCLNGQMLSVGERCLRANDFAVLYGAALFETFRTWHGRFWELTCHWRRLRESATWLGWGEKLPPDETLTEWVQQTFAVNRPAAPERDWRFRVTVSPGVADWQKGWWEWGEGEPTVLITATPLPLGFDARLKAGWQAVFAPWRRPKEFPLWQVKSANYLANLLARRYAHQQGAQEAIWLNTDGNLTEGTSTNLFLVVNGCLLTPPVEEGLLAGVTRQFILALAPQMGFPVKEVPLPLTMLDRAQEAFVTNAVVGVVPLTAMEGQRFQVRLTQRLRTRFLSHVCGTL
jgi:branched-chain amino acid aminotransferase